VTVTTIKEGTVVKRVRDAVYVKVEDGSTRKFTRASSNSAASRSSWMASPCAWPT
jgi:hypothetical protein